MAPLDNFKGILPYASELFGVYQPLLGWKSLRTTQRYERFRTSLYNELAARALVNASAPVEVTASDVRTGVAVGRIGRAGLFGSEHRALPPSLAPSPPP